ncbi:tRNA threonylcarbamoyladenosine dehydratase [Eggerthellaceae bacterium zg-893]|nr:tRNA threonylcarbamoyladenosine dehydratase [Eggerthellaceae bacterium zg-893]
MADREAPERQDEGAGQRRFSGTPKEKLEVLWGTRAVERLARSRVVVMGLGGVGSNCVEALARGGIGSFVLVDHDVVSPTNINRQAIAFCSTVGRKKCEVAKALVADINPQAHVVALDRFLWADDAEAFLDEFCLDADYVVDAIDSVSAKLALAAAAEKRGLRYISSMGGANKLRPECFRIADVYETVNDPLSRIMRKEGRKRGIKALKVLYSCEQPVKTQVTAGSTRRERSDLGTASFIPPIMGQMIAGEVLRELACDEPPCDETVCGETPCDETLVV